MAGRFASTAVDCVANAPRTGGTHAIGPHVEAYLERAYAQGKLDGAIEARGRMLREQLAIVQGIAQDATSRVRILEREIAEHEAQSALRK